MESRLRCILPAALACILLYFFSVVFFARLHYDNGLKLVEENKLPGASKAFATGIGLLQKRLPLVSDILFASDLQRLYVAQGGVFFKRAAEARDMRTFADWMMVATSFYQQGADINPLDIEAATGLARATAALEKPATSLQLKTSYDALPLFQHALALRPNGLEIHYLFIRYCHTRGMTKEMIETAAHLVEIYPQAYQKLKTEQFYDFTLREAMKEALEKSLPQQSDAKNALTALADIAGEEGNLAKAIELYRQAIEVSTLKNSHWNYYRLGTLQLEAGSFPDAISAFKEALEKSPDSQRLLQSIWARYREADKHQEFIKLCDAIAGKPSLAEIREIYLARSLIAMEQYGLASFHLEKVRNGRYAAESYIVSAQLAEKQQNWDDMELSSQRATVLEPKNSSYLYMFARALQKKKKYPQAEEAVTQAIENAVKPSPWYYNFRAWIRWSLNNVAGANADWEESVKLRPEDANFYYYLALSQERMKNRPAAREAIEKALQLKPAEKKYLEKYEQLKK